MSALSLSSRRVLGWPGLRVMQAAPTKIGARSRMGFKALKKGIFPIRAVCDNAARCKYVSVCAGAAFGFAALLCA
ncbi:hypothetical protein [Stenotrophomonas maltophilia]|uniref:hypothetical protein n=1 Tax=Stenotrophomonas maltophilia TaxID=40324 RepID=UPI001310D07A|nr:hypothetical protein [Stenotrophomonas maltophilia]